MEYTTNNKFDNIKLIVSDLDGTLLASDGSLSLYTQNIIKKLKTKGIIFSIASGRSDQMFLTFINQLDINVPVISSNGALIRNFNTKETIHKSTLDISEATTIMDYCKLQNIDYMTYTSEKVFFTHTSERIQKFYRYNEIAIENNIIPMDLYYYDDNHREIAEIGIIKILIYDKMAALDSIIPLLDKLPNTEYIQSEPIVMDISPKGTSKGAALEKLANYFNFNPSQIACFGDFINDISMMNFSDISFAPINSPEIVKKSATFITDSNDNNGVAKAIEQYFI